MYRNASIMKTYKILVIHLMNIMISLGKKCTSNTYSKFYEAAHNNDMCVARMYVEENRCCPTDTSSNHGNSALWIAQQMGHLQMVAYLESVNCNIIGGGTYLGV